MAPLLKFLVILSLLGITVAVYGGGYSSYEDYGRGGRHHRPPVRRPVRPPRARLCESGWLSFERPQGRWCIKVFYARSNWNAAQNGCRAHRAVLTGFQNGNERMQTANIARIVSSQFSAGLNEVWIDGVRNAGCPGRNSCPKLLAFRWTDGHTTGTDGFFWPGIEPSAHTNARLGRQSAIMMHLTPRNGMRGRFGYPHGSLDDDYFGQFHNLYACGKVPGR